MPCSHSSSPTLSVPPVPAVYQGLPAAFIAQGAGRALAFPNEPFGPCAINSGAAVGHTRIC
eukprot:SAG11_NODE_4488_length_1877_cov_1.387514_3_plen_61_part_00